VASPTRLQIVACLIRLSRAAETSCVDFAVLQIFAPHTHSKKALKNQKNASFSLSDVAQLTDVFECEEVFTAIFEVL
jgi:hypothetical protein